MAVGAKWGVGEAVGGGHWFEHVALTFRAQGFMRLAFILYLKVASALKGAGMIYVCSCLTSILSM